MTDKRLVIRAIQDIAASLNPGDTWRGICPECMGGRTEERSFAVTKENDNTARYICFRNSCSLPAGKVAVFGDGEKVYLRNTAPQSPVMRRHKEFYGLSGDAITFLKDRYKLSEDLIRYSKVRVTKDKRLAFPILSRNGVTKGYFFKTERGLYCGMRDIGSIPRKWVQYNEKEKAQGSWYRWRRHKQKETDTLIVVEDIISALRLTRYADSVALMGTNLLRPVIDDIKKQRYRRVFLALDSDATNKAFSLRKRFSLELPNLNVLVLPKDIKDMNQEEVDDVILPYLEEAYAA